MDKVKLVKDDLEKDPHPFNDIFKKNTITFKDKSRSKTYNIDERNGDK